MSPNDPHRLPDDLQPVADFLRANRPEATALELDAVKRHTLSRVRKGSTTMKSRLAMMAMLVFGLLMSGTGAGLAITGLSSSGDASVAQYGTQTTPPPDEIGTLPDTDSGDTTCDTDGDGVITPSEAAANGCGGVAGETDEEETIAPAPEDEPTAREEAAQPTRQAEAGGDDELPFTGFAAVPILAGGIALLAGGLVLRRRTAA